MDQLTSAERNAAKDLTTLSPHEARFVMAMPSTTKTILLEAIRIETAGQARPVIINALNLQLSNR